MNFISIYLGAAKDTFHFLYTYAVLPVAVTALNIIRDSNERGEIYVAEPHVRDKLIPPSKSLEWRRWQEAVKFINLNESRVCTERRVINGVECSVWRWIPAKKTGWQGNGTSFF
ncbi:unnamed protein product [Dracunculus medinensis]|uniref:Uncharacterized protein n=1 Tax=Dracunculus medinensis TaxID=318479 RepID=A0A3P7PXU2_DRAME|nr:unnamed protein product [Dracunculus medinensis]